MDLSKRETPSRSLPQRAFRRATTLPDADTDRDALEVNAPILRPNTASNAEALAKLLGVATDITGNIVGDIKAKADAANAAQAAFDFAAGTQDPERFKNSREYFAAWQREGAKAKSLDIAQKAQDAAQVVLNDPHATPADVDAAIERVFVSETHDERGNLLDFGTPEAKAILGHSLAEVKAKLMPASAEAIKREQDNRLLFTRYDNMLVERDRGAPIGLPNAAVDPLAPLPEQGEAEPPIVVTGDEPTLDAGRPAAQPKGPFPVAQFLEGLPPSISRAEAKAWLLPLLLSDAYKSRDTSALAGLDRARGADGQPIFTPAEMVALIKDREDLEGKFSKERDEEENRLHRANEDRILQAYVDGNPPSDSWIAAQASKGLVTDQFAYSMLAHNAAMARAEASEARQEARADRAQADSEINTDVASLAVTLEAGDPEALASTSEASLTQRWRNGDFGPLGSKSSLARYRTLRTALHQGQALVEKNPYYAKGLALLQRYKPAKQGGGNPLIIGAQSDRLDAGTYTEMLNRYRGLVDAGKDPGEAYSTVVDKFVRGRSHTPRNDNTALNRISYLKCKRAGLCS